jgi:glutamate-ammonia-ligase adenylyltransferase
MWLTGLGLRDPEQGARDLRDLGSRGLPRAPLVTVLGHLDSLLPLCPDPGMAVTNFERFVSSSPLPRALLEELAHEPRTVEALVQMLSTSQHFSEQIIRDPSLLDWLRHGAVRRDRDALIEVLWNELRETDDDDARAETLCRHRLREMLRIGYNDIVRGVPLEVTTLDLSHLADSCIEGAWRIAHSRAIERHGEPRASDGRPIGFVVLALGKLGGEELNYSSDIDLIFLYQDEGQTSGPRPIANEERFARMGGEIVRLLSGHTALGQPYRVDLRLRPEGDQGRLARSLAATLGYYETTGRTWERQALIKCRPVAGDLELGRRFLAAIEPFVYRRYLSGAEINEIKAMKRRIEVRTLSSGADQREVKTGRGGIRDVEFVVQFLQLLHGGEYVQVRHASTLTALSRLEAVGCLTAEERGIMEDTYRFLRRAEHRLQTMFDRQTHEIPSDAEEQRTLAIRMGYAPASSWEDRVGPAQRFLSDYQAKTELNRRILNHLLHDAFRDDDGTTADPVVDLVLDPSPSADAVATALAAYPFHDRQTAHRNLMALAREDIEFLSQARCRHFLAAIAPRLLHAVGGTPDPDRALTNLEKVSASLGAKAILWELFNFNPPTLRLYVELCANSQFLSEILINNPGMIDDLMDSLVVDRPQPASAIKAELAELCRGAEDLGPILLSFRNKEWVRIGTRDILAREPTRDVTRELADVAEAIIQQVARDQWSRQVARSGAPRLRGLPTKSRWAVVGLGKLGGRELNYHSDLDLIFVYEGEGATTGPRGSVPNDQFFSELVRGVLKAFGGDTGRGPLYTIDARLRPHGASGPLAVSLDSLRAYYSGTAQCWERMALNRARVLYGPSDFGRDVMDTVRDVLRKPIDPRDVAREVVAMRKRVEESRGATDLKRGQGGLADVEFLVHYLQLVHAHEVPDVLRPNIWDALEALRRAELLDAEAYDNLRDAYDFLRTVESRVRIVHNRSGAELPKDPGELVRLARRLNYDAPTASAAVSSFRADAARHATRTRAHFEQLVGLPAGVSNANINRTRSKLVDGKS